MKKRILSIALALSTLFAWTLPILANAEPAADEEVVAECTYVVDTTLYDTMDVTKRLFPTFVNIDFYGDGSEYCIYEFNQPIEDCTYFTLPVEITLDDPKFDASKVNWHTVAREAETGVWYACPGFQYTDGQYRAATWSSPEPHSIDAISVIPEKGAKVPGFMISMGTTMMVLGFSTTAAADTFTKEFTKKDIPKTTAPASGLSADLDAVAVERQQEGVVHIYMLHYDASKELDQWKGGTGFVVGKPGTQAVYIVTALENVLTSDRIDNPQDYRTIVLADGLFYEVENTLAMLMYEDTKCSLALLELDESIPNREPLILCPAASVSPSDSAYMYGFASPEHGSDPAYESYTDEEVKLEGKIIKGKDADDALGLLQAAISYTEEGEGAPVFNADGYVIGICTSGNSGSSSVILASDAIISALDSLEMDYAVLTADEKKDAAGKEDVMMAPESIRIFNFNNEIKLDFTLHMGDAPVRLDAIAFPVGQFDDAKFEWTVSDESLVKLTPSADTKHCDCEILGTRSGGVALTVSCGGTSKTLTVYLVDG